MNKLEEFAHQISNGFVYEDSRGRLDMLPIGAPTKDRAIDIARSLGQILKDGISKQDYEAFIEAAWRSARGPNRWILAGGDAKEMRRSIEDFIFEGRYVATGTRHTTPRRVTFVFSGMGPQWGGMGRELASTIPSFEEHVFNIDALFTKYYGRSVWKELYRHKDVDQLPTALAQAGNFLLQAALHNLLVDEDVTPDAILGHSAGEIAAAYAAGVYTLEEAVRVSVTRGKLQARLAGRGSMLAAGISRKEAVNLLADRQGVAIAAINDEKGITISGGSDEIAKIDGYLREHQIFSKILRVEVPYHSPIMDEITHEISEKLSFLKPVKAKKTIYSTVTGEQTDGPEWGSSYWACNIRQPVLFADALKLALEDGSNCFIEISPHPVLSQSINSLSEGDSSVSIKHLLSRRDSEYDSVLSCLGELAIDGVGRPRRRTSAPLLRPVLMPQKLWDEDPEVEAVRRGEYAAAELPLLGRSVPGKSKSYEVEISTTDYPWISGHAVQELGVIVPATMWIELITLAASEGSSKSVRLVNLMILQSLPISDNLTIVSTRIEGGIARCQSRPVGKTSAWTLHALASVTSVSVSEGEHESSIDGSMLSPPTGTKIESEQLYQAFKSKGLNYSEYFKNLSEVTIGEGSEAWATIEAKTSYTAGRHSPWVLDAGLQLLIAAAKDWGEAMYLPFKIGRVTMHQPLSEEGIYHAYAIVSVRKESELIGTVRFYGSNRQLLGSLEEITCLRNISDDIERGNYLDMNTYTLRNLTPEEIAASFSIEGDHTQTETVVVDEKETGVSKHAVNAKEIIESLNEYWIKDIELNKGGKQLSIDRPYIDLNAIKGDSHDHLLWNLPSSELKQDILAAAQIIQKVGKLGIRTLTLTILAQRGQEWISGMRRSAANSYGFNIRVVFTDDTTSLEMLEAAVALVREKEIYFDGDDPLFRRLEKVTGEQLRSIHASIDGTDKCLPASTISYDFVRGKLSNLVQVKEQLRKPNAGEICIEVDATALMWKDIGKILGTIGTGVVNTLTGHHMGFGISGTVVDAGAGARFSIGERVFGAVRRPYRQYITLDVQTVSNMRRVPDSVDNVTAIALAVPWMTALGVFDAAKPKKGDKIFIQSGAGGLGSVLCLCAKQLGTEVVTSVGTKEKIAEVKKVVADIDVVVARGEAIPDALINAGHDSFDWVIATLNGGARTRLLSLLNNLGYYFDLGKPHEADESIFINLLDGNKSYFTLDIDQLCVRVPGWLDRQMDRMTEKVSDPANHVPVKRYPVSKMSAALQDMAKGDTTGCVAITISSQQELQHAVAAPPVMDPDASYIITGGYGAVGLICAQWLSSRGARHIILSGSSGLPSKDSLATIELLRAGGNEINVLKTDSTDRRSVMDFVQQAVSERSVRGIIHAAGAVSDGPFDEIDAERIERSFGAKLEGAYHLVDALDATDVMRDLDFLIFTSSVSSVVGLSIQGTYAAANTGLDGLAVDLCNRGINACAVQLGPIDAGGMAAEETVQRYYSAIGLSALSPRRMYGVLDLAVEANVPHFFTDDVDWARNGRAETANTTSSLLSHIIEEAMSGRNEADIEQLLSLDDKDRTEVLTMTLLGIITEAVGVKEGTLNKESNFISLGIDSLAIMEVQAGVNEVLQQDLPLARMFTQGGTIGQLASQVSEYLEKNMNKSEEAA
jgi:acyl transferase domain-containing protein/NADPH:quinone reductase-like Zn-dependent oxidoreductase/acyl carrier protein